MLEFNEDKGDTYFKSMGNFAFGLTKWSKHTGDFKNTKQKVLAFEAKFTKVGIKHFYSAFINSLSSSVFTISDS